jgi:hypothetical protein
MLAAAVVALFQAVQQELAVLASEEMEPTEAQPQVLVW